MVDVDNDIKRTYYLPPDIDHKIKVAAAEDSIKQSDIVRIALEEFFIKRGKKR